MCSARLIQNRRLLVWAAALATLGSGLINIYSVIGPGLPWRMRLLRQVFPLGFIGVSRHLTLLIGFALVISSVNILKRKSRALKLAVALSLASALFHLAKGVDYEEATLSLALCALLLNARDSFRVKSAAPDWREALLRPAAAMSLALGYAIAGFWLLDRRQFGMDFTMGQALRQALSLLSLAGGPVAVPHTRYAHWFVDSVYVTAAASILYSGFALFRPVIYRWHTQPQEHRRAGEILARYGRSSLDFFKLWPDKSYFFSESGRSFIAYRVAANFAVVLADPVGPEDEMEDLLRDFIAFCRENDWGFGFHQTLADFLPVYRRIGLKKLKIGDDAYVDLSRFTLEGAAMSSLRRAVSKLEKKGIEARIYRAPLPDEVLAQLREVSDEWLRLPGRRERQFSLGQFVPEYVRNTPVIAATDAEGRVLAFMNIVPSYRPREATVDLMRRRTSAPNGVIDFLFIKLFAWCREKGYDRFNLGMAPMAGFQQTEQPTAEERAVHYFFQRLTFLFSFKGLRDYKAKFATGWEPRYTIYTHVLELPRLALALGGVSELNRRNGTGR